VISRGLGHAYSLLGRSGESLTVLTRVLEIRMEKLGSQHGDTLETMCDLAVCFHAVGKREEALPLLKETIICMVG